MEWSVKKQEYSARYKDSKGRTWGYLTGKELMERYPNGGYRIVADMRRKEGRTEDLLLKDKGAAWRLHPYRRKKKRLERTVGYIDVSTDTEKDVYVRIVKRTLFRGLILPVLIFLLLAGGVFLGWWLSRQNQVPGLDEAAVSYRVEGMKNTDPESIALPGISLVEMEAGQRTVEFPLINPEGNVCYMKYIIRDAQTGEVLYRSGLIGPGQAILSFDLNRPVEAGTYDILLQVETSDLDDYTVRLNGAEIPAELEAK